MGQKGGANEQSMLTGWHFGRRMLWASVLLVLTVPAPYGTTADAAELVAAHVSRASAGYNIRTEVVLDANPARVRNTLTEYGKLPALNPNIEQVDFLPNHQEDQTRLRMHTKACFLIICQRYRWVQRVSMLPDGQIFALVEPSDSDFYSGWFRYRFIPDGERCRLILEAHIAPKEGVSSNPVVRAVMRHVLANEAITLANRLEETLANTLTNANGPTTRPRPG